MSVELRAGRYSIVADATTVATARYYYIQTTANAVKTIPSKNRERTKP